MIKGRRPTIEEISASRHYHPTGFLGVWLRGKCQNYRGWAVIFPEIVLFWEGELFHPGWFDVVSPGETWTPLNPDGSEMNLDEAIRGVEMRKSKIDQIVTKECIRFVGQAYDLQVEGLIQAEIDKITQTAGLPSVEVQLEMNRETRKLSVSWKLKGT